MGACLNKDAIRDIEIELGIIKTENQLHFEYLSAELKSFRRTTVQKNRRRSCNPYANRRVEEYI